MSAKPLQTAEAQLERILYVLPAASGDNGASLDVLARALDVSRETIIRDIEQVTTREYYHPAGSTDAFGIFLDGDRVKVTARHEYRRPVRLNAAEALAVDLGLRVLALDASAEDAVRILAFGRRIQDELVAPEILPSAFMVGESNVEYDVEEEAEVLFDLGDDALRGVISDAITAGDACELTYLKPADAHPSSRRILPQKLIYSDGFWYVLAFDVDREDTRFFRVDRILNATVTQLDIVPDAAAKSAQVAELPAPYMAEEDREVAVRYAPSIARWITERTGVEAGADGCVVLRHRVADTKWLVRHVLQYAGDAVVEDGEYRVEVRQAAERMAG